MKRKKTSTSIIVPLDHFIRLHPKTHLGSALTQTKNNHEAIFIFDNSKFLGLSSPYTDLFKKRLPYTTKLSHTLFKPPHITWETPLYDIADFMLASEIYTLPVFENKDKIAGVIVADKIVERVINTPHLIDRIAEKVKIKKPITVNVHTTVKDAYNLMRTKKITRVLLVDNDNKLQAIVSQRDLEDAFIAKTVKQRYSTRLTKKNEPLRSSFDEKEEIYRIDSPIMEFAIPRVVSAPSNLKTKTLIKRMMKSKRHSIVITKAGKPVGFIARHDILKTIASLKPKITIPTIWQKPHKGLDNYFMQNSYYLIDRFVEKFNKRYPIQQIEVHIDEPRNAAGIPKRFFTIKLHVLLKSGKLLLATAQRKIIEKGMREVIDEIENDMNFSDRQKHVNKL